MCGLPSVVSRAWCFLRFATFTSLVVSRIAASVLIAYPLDKLQLPRANGAFESRHTMIASVHVSRVMRSARAAMYMCASCVGPMYVIQADVTERERGRFLKI